MDMPILQTKVFSLLVKYTSLLQNRGLGRLPGVRGMRDILYKILTPKQKTYLKFDGFQMYVDPQDTGVSRELIGKNIYESLETSLFLETVTTNSVIVDVGANIGYYSLLAVVGSQGSATVYSFEPEPNSYRYLLDNIELNQTRAIVPVNMALSDQEGSICFFVHDSNGGKHSIVKPGTTSTQIHVEATTLDLFARNHHLKRLDILKLDVEGAEGRVINGAIETIRRFRPIIFMEYTPDWLAKTEIDPEKLLHTLQTLGYSISLIDTRHQRVQPTDIDTLRHFWKTSKWLFQANLLLRPQLN